MLKMMVWSLMERGEKELEGEEAAQRQRKPEGLRLSRRSRPQRTAKRLWEATPYFSRPQPVGYRAKRRTPPAIYSIAPKPSYIITFFP
jgi:hypothetical protein